MFAGMYGHTGRRKDATASKATNTLSKLAHGELNAQPKGPKIIHGDLNADTLSLPHLCTLIEKGVCTDIGTQTQLWGCKPKDDAGLGHNTKDATRNAYAIVNSA